jgi:adenylosuccinate synthase
MSGTVIVGTSFGDEGKGKVVDIYSERSDMVVRYAGGSNAGHTLIVNGEKTILRLIPSGILWPHTVCVLAQGMVIDPFVLVEEITKLEQKGLKLEGRLFISDMAHLVLPYHLLVDEKRESNLFGTKIGTTKRGIGPAYEDKVGRRGVRMVEFLGGDLLADRIMAADSNWDTKLDRLDLLNKLIDVKLKLAPFIKNTSSIINAALSAGRKVLFEGAQGTLLDIDHGTYPYVTSSNTVAGGACTGSGVGPTKIKKVIGITKAYVTRVGEGPFLTEISGRRADYLRQQGQEYGSVTGRPRRVGWLDLPALKYAVQVNGIDALAITKIDVLSGVDQLQVCSSYEYYRCVDTAYSPVKKDLKPIYQELPGWQQSLDSIRNWDSLPPEVRGYVGHVEAATGVPVCLVSVGPDRNQTIILREEFL